MFFDGEEAFKYWTSTDSLYGSRNYAKMLQNQYGQRAFSTIDLFVLLDLIGGNSGQIPNYFPKQTSKYYSMLSKIGICLIGSLLIFKLVFDSYLRLRVILHAIKYSIYQNILYRNKS